MTSISELTEEIHTTALQIQAFRGHAEANEAIDLAGLEARVEALCAMATALAPTDRQTVKKALTALMDEMNRLVATLEEGKAAMAQQIGGLTARQKAVSAYGTGAAVNQRSSVPADNNGDPISGRSDPEERA